MCDHRVETLSYLDQHGSALVRWAEETGGVVEIHDGRSPKRGPFWLSTERPARLPEDMDDSERVREWQHERFSAIRGPQCRELASKRAAQNAMQENWEQQIHD